MKRQKTNYPGVFYRDARRISGKGAEKVYYIIFKKNGKLYEEKAGRQYLDDMTPARAAGIRAERIEGKRLSRKENRKAAEAEKKAQESKRTIQRLRELYKTTLMNDKSRSIDEGRYKKYLKDKFGNKEPGELILLDIDRLRLKTSKELSPQSVKHILTLLDRIINFGVKRNLCSPLPFHIKKPQVNNLKTEDLNPEQLKNLLEAIDEDDNIHAKNIMKLALFTGMRRGEMFKLKWGDIDFDRGFINIRGPKGGRDQKIPLNNEAQALLQGHPREDSEHVFPGRGGRQRVTINEAVNRIKGNAGLPKDFRPLHGLRHVYASMLASSGQVDTYTLQKLLTHKSPVMTQRYAHLRDETLKRAADLAGNIITKFDKDKDSENEEAVNIHRHDGVRE